MPGLFDPQQEGEWGDRSVERGFAAAHLWVGLTWFVYPSAVLGLHAAGWDGAPLYIGAVSAGVVLSSVTLGIRSVRARRRRRLSTAARAWRQRQGIRR